MLAGLWLLLLSFSLTTVAPLAFAAALLAELVLCVIAALSLRHTGGFLLENWPAFAPSLKLALGATTLAACAAVGVTVRDRWEPAPTSNSPARRGWWRRHPFYTIAASLAGAFVVIVRKEWDGNPWLPDPLSIMVIFAGFYFFAVAVPLWLGWTLLGMTRWLVRLCHGSQYWCGLVSGLLLLLSLPGLLAWAFLPELGRERAARLERSPAEAVAAALEQAEPEPSFAAANWSFFRLLDGALEERADSSATAPSLSTAGLLGGGGVSDAARMNSCFERLALEETKLRAWLSSQFRLGEQDASDAVREALLDVCLAHARRPYDKLLGAFWTAARNKARDEHNRKKLLNCYAPLFAGDCAYPALADDSTRFAAEQRELDRAWCDLEELERAIIVRRIWNEESFRDIGTALDLTELKAKDTYWNAIRRMRQRLDRCH